MAARKRLESGLNNWSEVDDTLRKIGHLERRIEQEEANLQETIAKAKAAATAAVKKLQAEIKIHDLQLKAFCQDHQADLGDKKSKVLNFGKVGFQFSTKVTVPRKKEAVLEVVKKLKELGLQNCIQVKETPIKNEIKKLAEDTLAKLEAVGVTKKGGDTFYHEVFREKIVEAA